MLIGPQGPPWWIFFQNFFKNVLVYPQLTQKYVLWHSKLEKSILGRRELKSIFGLVGRGTEFLPYKLPACNPEVTCKLNLM